MVKYSCEICGKNYGKVEEAKGCENQELIGFSFEPGLMFSHKQVKEGFFILYKETKSNKHERQYLFEEVYAWSPDHISGVQNGQIKYSDLEKYLVRYKLSNSEEVDFLNAKLKEMVSGIRGIDTLMKKYGIEKLHNNLDVDSIKKDSN
jgi:hypothetical protein